MNKVIPNLTDFCPNIIKTCCSQSDFQNIKNWWQVDKKDFQTILQETRIGARKRKQEQIYLYTNELINLFRPLKDAAKTIIKK